MRVGTSFQHPYPPHWHEEFFFSGITAGAGHFSCRGRDHIATPGSLVIVVPGEVHSHHDCNNGRSFRSLHAPVPFVRENLAELSERAWSLSVCASSLITGGNILGLFLRLHRQLEDGGTQLLRESLLLAFFAEFLKHVSMQRWHPAGLGHEHRAVRLAEDFLRDHYHQEVSLKELSALANLSPYHFHRVFRRQIGMPPHAYQIHIRMLRAKALLKERYSIADIAASTGFADQSHFTRHFKRFFGVTPAQYAAGQQERSRQ